MMVAPPLKPYQEESVKFLADKGRAILADEMGLGKTRTALEAAALLWHDNILVVCPKFALGVWEDEVKKWVPGYTTLVYTGSPGIRARLFIRVPRQIVITNVELVHELPNGWDLVILDEVHMKIRNRKNLAFSKVDAKINSPASNNPDCFLLSGSPVVRGADDLWAYLRLLQPKRFTSFWRFVETYCYVTRGFFGTKIEGVKAPQQLRELLTHYMVRHRKTEVETQLPSKTRQTIWLEMTPKQKRLYESITHELIVELEGSDELLLIPNVLAQITRLRQCLVTPRLLGVDEDGAALKALAEMIQSLEHPPVIFTPFRKALQHIQDHASEEKVLEIVGGMTSSALRETVNKFQGGTNTFPLAVVIQSAASYSLSRASTAIVIGPDWTPAVMEQAEDRLHRIGQKNPVHIQYLLHRDTVEDKVMEAINKKLANVTAILKPSDFS